MRSTRWFVTLAVLSGCGDNAAAPDDGGGSANPTPTYTIGGSISGLVADGLVLEDNGGDALSISANATSFTFATRVARGDTYSATVQTQPSGELCTVHAGYGTPDANIQSVQIVCTVQHSAAGEWAWVGGSDVATNFGLPGIYGTLGVADAANAPGGRHQATSWSDAAGNLWMFGGYGVDATGQSGQLDDLWKYDPAAGAWTWVNGTTTAPASQTGGAAGSSGVYGTLGTAAAANVPGGREQVSSWHDASGAIWLFGGEGIDVNGVTGELNDLWKFANGQWTWMGGSNSVGSGLVFPGRSGIYGTVGTAAASNIPGGRYGAVQWTDAHGDLWLFGGSGVDSQPFMQLGYLNDLWKYSPTTGQWTWMAGANTFPSAGGGASGVYGTLRTASATNYPGGRDAAMSWVDATGNVWMFGGLGIDSADTFGFENDLWKYDPTANRWTWISGSKINDNGLGQSGVYGTRGVAAAANVPGGRYSGATWIDHSGKLWLLGGQGLDSTGNVIILNDLWTFDPATNLWTWMGGSVDGGNNGGQGGVYGTRGSSAAANTPGGRYGIATWTDAAGKFWMFGGMGYDSTDGMGYLNDFWTYLP